MSVLRALLLTDPFIIISTICFGTVGFLVSLFDSVGNAQISVARVWARSILLVAGVKVTIEGMEKIKPGGAYVLACNHASYMDTPVILTHIPLQFRFLAKDTLFKIPFLGTHLKTAGHMPVPREDPRAALKTLTAAAKNIQEKNISMLIFPEGGRTKDGNLQPFKEGVAYMAIKAGVPIVPIALIGTRAVVPIHSGIVKSGPVTVAIGDPIETASLSIQDRGRVTEQVREQIAGMLAKYTG